MSGGSWRILAAGVVALACAIALLAEPGDEAVLGPSAAEPTTSSGSLIELPPVALIAAEYSAQFTWQTCDDTSAQARIHFPTLIPESAGTVVQSADITTVAPGWTGIKFFGGFGETLIVGLNNTSTPCPVAGTHTATLTGTFANGDTFVVELYS